MPKADTNIIISFCNVGETLQWVVKSVFRSFHVKKNVSFAELTKCKNQQIVSLGTQASTNPLSAFTSTLSAILYSKTGIALMPTKVKRKISFFKNKDFDSINDNVKSYCTDIW